MRSWFYFGVEHLLGLDLDEALVDDLALVVDVDEAFVGGPIRPYDDERLRRLWDPVSGQHRHRPRGVRIGRMSKAAIATNTLTQAAAAATRACVLYRDAETKGDRRERQGLIDESMGRAKIAARLLLDELANHGEDLELLVYQLVEARKQEAAEKQVGGRREPL